MCSTTATPGNMTTSNTNATHDMPGHHALNMMAASKAAQLPPGVCDTHGLHHKKSLRRLNDDKA
jgi:hypothetical protein